MCVCVCMFSYVITINEQEAMNLREGKGQAREEWEKGKRRGKDVI